MTAAHAPAHASETISKLGAFRRARSGGSASGPEDSGRGREELPKILRPLPKPLPSRQAASGGVFSSFAASP